MAPLVADPADLRQHPHGLLARLRLHWVASQVGVASVTSLKLLLETPPLLVLVRDLVKRMVLNRDRTQNSLGEGWSPVSDLWR